MAFEQAKSGSYHHGDLATALLDAVEAIAKAEGLEAISIRACARLIGVSPSAAFRHYQDKRHLMTAFATRGLQRLLLAIDERREEADEDVRAQFLAAGTAYIAFAVRSPSEFRTMWRHEIVDGEDDHYRAANELLEERLTDMLIAEDAPDPDQQERRRLLAWGAVHGLAELLVDGPLSHAVPHNEQVRLMAGVLREFFPATEPGMPAVMPA